MKKYFTIFFLFVALVGCTTYHGLKPITPKVSDQTTSVHPTFTWKPSKIENIKYDFIIYDLIMKRTAGLNYVPVGGKTVYYRESLDKCEHTVEADLEPGKEYLWSVRVREGNKVGPWSLYDFHAYYIFGYVIQKNYPFKLKIVDPNAPETPDD